MGYAELSVSVGLHGTQTDQPSQGSRGITSPAPCQHMAIMRSQGDLDSPSVSDISQPLSKWHYIYIPIGEN